MSKKTDEAPKRVLLIDVAHAHNGPHRFQPGDEVSVRRINDEQYIAFPDGAQTDAKARIVAAREGVGQYDIEVIHTKD